MGRNRKTSKRLMYRSPQYTAWLRQFGLSLMAQGVRRTSPISTDFRIKVILGERRRLSDMDNVAAKALLDALQTYNIIQNDSLCIGISSEYGEVPSGCKIVLTW